MIKPTSLNAALNPKSVLPRKTIAVYICQFDKEIEGLDNQAKRFQFTNDRTYYYSTNTAGNPYISDYHKNLVVDFFYDYYGSNTTTGINKVGAVLSNLNKKWEGSCHGMSIAFLFDAMGKVDFNRYIGAYSMRTIPYPKNSNLVASSLNFYQVACNYHVDFCNKYQKSSGNMATGLSAMASDFDKYGAILLSYFWPGQDDEGNPTTSGHTVVVLDMESNGNMSYSVSYYDSRYQSIRSSTASINDGYIAFDALSNITTIQYYSQLEYHAMDGLDLDGAYNNMNHGDTMNSMELPDALPTAQFADSHAGKTYIIAPATDFTIVNANGETLHFSEGVLSGNMDYDDLYFIPYGDGSPAEVSFVVDDSESFNLDLFNDNTENIRIYVSCEEYSTSVIGSGFTNLHFQTDDIAVMGSDIEITAIVRSNSGNDEYTRFYGTGDTLINIEQTDSQIIASGFYGDSVQLYDRTLAPSNMIHGVIDAQEIIIDYEEDPIIPPVDQMYSDEADAVVYYVSDFYS